MYSFVLGPRFLNSLSSVHWVSDCKQVEQGKTPSHLIFYPCVRWREHALRWQASHAISFCLRLSSGSSARVERWDILSNLKSQSSEARLSLCATVFPGLLSSSPAFSRYNKIWSKFPFLISQKLKFRGLTRTKRDCHLMQKQCIRLFHFQILSRKNHNRLRGVGLEHKRFIFNVFTRCDGCSPGLSLFRCIVKNLC